MQRVQNFGGISRISVVSEVAEFFSMPKLKTLMQDDIGLLSAAYCCAVLGPVSFAFVKV
jgi:hypothetical protein